MAGKSRAVGRSANHKHMDNAMRAVLHMIDTQDKSLKTSDEQNTALKDLIEEKELTLPKQFRSPEKKSFRFETRTVPFTVHELRSQLMGMGTRHLRDGIKPSSPRCQVIFERGTAVIKSHYLALIGYIDDSKSEDEEEEDEVDIHAEIVPSKCSLVEGNEECEKKTTALFRAGKGYYCQSCVEYACEELSVKVIGGCSNPFRKSTCKRDKLKEPDLFKGHVLCSPCHATFQEDETQHALQTAAKKSTNVEKTTTSATETPKARAPTASQPRATSRQRSLGSAVAHDLVVIDSESEAGADPPISRKTSPKKRSLKDAPSTNQAAITTKRPRLDVTTDEIHQFQDAGIANTEIQRTMDSIFEKLRIAVLFFHSDTSIDPNSPAQVLNADEVSGTLSVAYGQLLGGDGRKIFQIVADRTLSSYNMLLGLLGALLHHQVFIPQVDIPSLEWKRQTLAAIKAQLSCDDDEMNKFQRCVALREVNSSTFSDSMKSCAEDLAQSMMSDLLPHIHLAMDYAGTVVRSSEWLPACEESLAEAIRTALMLKARMQVSGQTHVMTWFSSKTNFDRRTMKETNDASEMMNQEDLKIAVTLCGGWTLDDEIAMQARVCLDVMKHKG